MYSYLRQILDVSKRLHTNVTSSKGGGCAAVEPGDYSVYDSTDSFKQGQGMASTQPPKLTKKQKKGIAFRERRTNKGKHDPSAGEIPGQQIPIAEDQDLAEMEDDDVEVEKVEGKKGNNRNKDESTRRSKDDESAEHIGVEVGNRLVEKPKKRKRSEEGQTDEDESAKPRKKKRDVDQVAKNGQATEKQRFILFVGEILNSS